jgi:putative thiamine transport system ATP-binding protein
VLASEPRALLLDEPFSKLDLTLRDRFRSLVFQSTTHLPVLLVSHDPQDSVAAGGDVLQLRPNHGHGRIR